MYGTNEVAKARPAEQGLLLHSAFYTIQGEGPFAGKPAIFLRFAGCNLRCFWCDTEFESPRPDMFGGTYKASELAVLIYQLRRIYSCDLFVITGGEPMLQPLSALFDELWATISLQFQIETAGSVWPSGLEDCTIFAEQVTIVTSPKTKRIHTKVEQYTDAWKYIIRAGETSPIDGLPIYGTQVKGSKVELYRPPEDTEKTEIFVQAMDEQGIHRARANLEAAAKIAMQFGYRLSVQLHKIVGLD